MTPPFAIKGLGEIAIRCRDIDRMTAFYKDVIGLPVMADFRELSGIVFFNISPLGGGYGGHTTILALFAHDARMRDVHPTDDALPKTGATSSLHHVALTVRAEDQDAARAWFTSRDIPYVVEDFGWVGWRGVFVKDPDGNTVELVAHREEWKTV
ncbi:MAG: VOC family protein [Pseudomonadota bacterium]